MNSYEVADLASSNMANFLAAFGVFFNCGDSISSRCLFGGQKVN